MRISGGTLRGRQVAMPKRGTVRPTSARVREALFSMLGQDLQGTAVLDACAGSGLLSLEAWSRGASPVLACDQDPAVVAHLRRVVAGLGADIAVKRADSMDLLQSGGAWDLVLLDPPYADDPADWLAAASTATTGTLVLECRSGASLPALVGPLHLDRQRRYGDSTLAIYRGESPS